MGYMDNLMGLFGYGPSNMAARDVNVARAGQARQLEDEYGRAAADPNSGVGLTPAQQQMQEQELANSVRSRMSSAGAGRSGAANDSVQKSIVDYRIAQMAQHQRYLDSLRGAMLTASSPQTEQPTAGQSAMSRFVTQGAGSAANALFGPEDQQRQTPQGGMGVTPTGGDPRGQGPNGPNGRGPNNPSYGP